MTLRQRFIAKVSPAPSGCLEWTGYRTPKGYGMFRAAGKVRQAHRVAFELWVGPIPDGLLVLHRCDNPPCVDGAHLFLGTNQDNMDDMCRKGRHPSAQKTHCPHGHPYDKENTHINRVGARRCRTCNRAGCKARRLTAKLSAGIPSQASLPDG